MAVTVPSDRRFLRSQVHTTRRRRIRARPAIRAARALLVLALLAYGGYKAAHTAMGVRWLRVQHISVVGNQRLPTSEVVSLIEGLKGDSLLTTDLERWRARLLASPWVADATLRRRLPATVEVEIQERRPFGIARVGSDLQLVDSAGTIDEFGPRYADLDLPIIDGLIRDDTSPKPPVDRTRAQLVSRLVADLRMRPGLAQRVSQIDVRDAHDVHVILGGDSAVIRLGDSQFADRLQSYVELQATLRQRVPDIDYVDLRFGERVFVGPARSASASPVTRGASAPARDPGARQRP